MSDIELIDSHCHLIFENFEKDLDDVVLRLRSKGVKKLVHACCELTEIPKLKKISHEFNEIYYSVGLHPLEAKKWEQSSKSRLKKSAQEDRRVVAIGELGLDFFKNEKENFSSDLLITSFSLITPCVMYGDRQDVFDLLSGPKSKFLNFEYSPRLFLIKLSRFSIAEALVVLNSIFLLS